MSLRAEPWGGDGSAPGVLGALRGWFGMPTSHYFPRWDQLPAASPDLSTSPWGDGWAASMGNGQSTLAPRSQSTPLPSGTGTGWHHSSCAAGTAHGRLPPLPPRLHPCGREPRTAECGARGGGRGPGGGRVVGADLSGILMLRPNISAWKICMFRQNGQRKWCRAARRARPWARGNISCGPLRIAPRLGMMPGLQGWLVLGMMLLRS